MQRPDIAPVDEALAERAGALEWLLFDVDGVLTDGRLFYDRRGEELKVFHVRDGLGFRLAQRAGLKLGLFSGRRCKALERRAAELDFDHLILGSKDKGVDFDQFLERQSTSAPRVAFIGDDLQDLPVLGRCGLSFCPADAAAEVRAVADRVLETSGGQGAAREMIEILLKSRGDWRDVLARYSFDS